MGQGSYVTVDNTFKSRSFRILEIFISVLAFRTVIKMICLKLIFVFSCFCLLTGFSEVEAASKTTKREVETPQENNQLEKVQQQLMTAFDSFKKSMEELASKLNTQDIVQGVQNFTSKLEDYAKQAADQFASTASGSPNVESKKEESS